MSEEWEQLVAAARSRVGTTIDQKWTLDSVLGVGGMAAVFAATHRNGKRAAVKVLHPAVAVNANIKARFLREGYVANKVDHPGAVSIVDDDEAPDGTVYLVMELLSGESLESKCARRLLEPIEVLEAASQLLDVLAAAHDKGIVHRDLKPANIFVTRDGTVKVLDFGIARLRENKGSAAAQVQTQHSLGTPGFMPPEQARGLADEVDARTDIWALGATMFTALSGRSVHEARTVNEQLLAAMTEPAPAVASVRGELPEAVCEVVDRALAFDAAARWPSARAMRVAVRDAYERLTGTGIPGLVRASLAGTSESSPPMSLGALALAATQRDASEPLERSGGVQPERTPSAPRVQGDMRTPAGAAVSVKPPKRRVVPYATVGGAVGVVAILALVIRGAGSAPPTPASPSVASSSARTDPLEAVVASAPSTQPESDAGAVVAQPHASASPSGTAVARSPRALANAPRTLATPVAPVSAETAAAPPVASPSAAPAASVNLFEKRH